MAARPLLPPSLSRREGEMSIQPIAPVRRYLSRRNCAADHAAVSCARLTNGQRRALFLDHVQHAGHRPQRLPRGCGQRRIIGDLDLDQLIAFADAQQNRTTAAG